MCGIAGAVSIHLAPERMRADVLRMNGYLTHRGPDGDGIWADDGVVLGHRRLAIIDLSPGGAQPMTSTDGTLAMIVNGEIYNYRALRADLEKRGHRFKGQSDVEVILPLYQEHGPDCHENERGVESLGRHTRLALGDGLKNFDPQNQNNEDCCHSQLQKGVLQLQWGKGSHDLQGAEKKHRDAEGIAVKLIAGPGARWIHPIQGDVK